MQRPPKPNVLQRNREASLSYKIVGYSNWIGQLQNGIYLMAETRAHFLLQ